MTIEISGVDVNSGLDLCDGDVDIYLRILRSYVSDMVPALERIRTVSEGTLKDYAVSIHGVKSISAAIGAEEARKTAKQLEDMAKGGDLAGVLAKNGAFVKYAENLVNGVRLWLEKNDAAGGKGGR